MTDDRRPLGLPVFSAPHTDAPAVPDRRPLPPIDRALFLPPPGQEAPAAADRRPLATGGLTFSEPTA
ncbi:hypothetical protein [Kitasatospora sp. DSM 101779]|uniref:hypothetical protein n=1 Tax=Kitasatospora sp. DSM 101779 TaxID=2853165 RepID=UPI0021DA44B6|nr:hypothetical protein [Kitasatospora sp. DSM 101779]MCU7820714.1 hypothetical protein [Kitasatospora sp. DSM 101779]